MPERDNLQQDLAGEHDVGVLLMGQMGGVPNELQLVVQTATYDAEIQGLREKTAYIIRVLSVAEHRMNLGLFTSLFFAEQHPILLHHNEPRVQVYFEGKPADLNELVLDIHQAHASTFGPWRELAEDINREKPLVNLLNSGKGLLGEMPRTAALRMVNVLEHHRMQATMVGSLEDRETEDEHGRSMLYKLLGIGDSYFVALDFAVDRMGHKQPPAG